MSKYEFKLTPAYCLFNGVAIQEQKAGYINFLLEKPEDDALKNRLKRSFEEHIETVQNLTRDKNVCIGNSEIHFTKCNRTQIRKYVSELYASESVLPYISGKKKTGTEEAAAVLLLDRILIDGKTKGATDIHIENKSIRLRINGSLEKLMVVSGKRYEELIRRIKLLSGMNVLEKRKSQDGHFVYGNKSPLFVRASSVCVIDNEYVSEESIVLRLLDTTRIPLALDYLGFNEKQLEKIECFQELKNGLVLVCGPTGSGKSTTVASILVEIERRFNGKLKIISLEDPPEYVIPGVSQIKIEHRVNGYKEALNHIFRLDPDVIMIGEIRDEESAEAALKASLTGHLVFATLHTSSVSEAVFRLENLGVDRSLLCSVLKGVICQELNYLGDEMKLYSDIGIPVPGFPRKVNRCQSEEEIDELFIHETNYSELFSKTLEMLNKKQWKVSAGDGEIYKGIAGTVC